MHEYRVPRVRRGVGVWHRAEWRTLGGVSVWLVRVGGLEAG